jgi:hypothetical protein
MTTNHCTARVALAAILTLVVSAALVAQPSLDRPRTSPHATVSQKIGVTEVSVNYHRPGVKGREIWGGLVPYGEVWRTGANEVTTISFGDPVTIEGSPLAAGTYGFFTLPRQGGWTIIFSSNTTTWGTVYDSTKDVLKLEVTPRAVEPTEWMSFTFSGLSDTGATLELRWEKLSVPVRIGVKTIDVVLGKARKEFATGADSGRWQMLRQAAVYANAKGVHLDEAMGWIDRSIAVDRNFQSLCVKADILSADGNVAAAASLVDEAVAAAKEKDVTGYARTLGFDGRWDRAIELLGKFSAKHGETWSLHRATGDAYQGAGDREKALSHLEKALGGAPDDAAKAELRKSIETISSGK